MIKSVDLEKYSENNISDILFQLRLKGYGYIAILYSGSGDSGSIDEVYLLKKEDAKETEDGIINLSKSIWDLEKDCLSDNLQNIFTDIAYEKILNDSPDWYNNEGGGGMAFICTEDGHFYSDHYINIVETEHYDLQGNILK